eukprot:6256982-Prymnesium_polylepis.1
MRRLHPLHAGRRAPRLVLGPPTRAERFVSGAALSNAARVHANSPRLRCVEAVTDDEHVSSQQPAKPLSIECPATESWWQDGTQDTHSQVRFATGTPRVGHVTQCCWLKCSACSAI